jgi:hypothetical protein
MRRFVTSVASWLAAIVLAAGVSTTARGQISVLSSTVEEHTGAPGESYTGRIAISNTSADSQAVRIYQTDYRFLANGTSSFDQAGSTPRSNAHWISLQSAQVVVGPHTAASVPYTVVIPRSDSLRGTYWSVVMVEGIGAPATLHSVADRPQVGITTVIRYAVQVATHIGSTGTRTIHLSAPRATQQPDSGAFIDADVENTGDRGYRPQLWIEIYDAQGKLRATAKQSRGLLYPGTSLHQRFALGVLPPGTYKAVVYADTGEDSVYAAQYTVVF